MSKSCCSDLDDSMISAILIINTSAMRNSGTAFARTQISNNNEDANVYTIPIENGKTLIIAFG